MLAEYHILQSITAYCKGISIALLGDHVRSDSQLNSIFLGALAMPRWASVSSVNTESTHTSSLASGKSIEQSLLTTCVGSVHELTELLACINTRPLTWTPPAIQALFYFMRCSQVKFYSNLFHYKLKIVPLYLL